MSHLNFACLFALLLFAIITKAQSGEIMGKVTDNKGEDVNKIKLTVTDSTGVVVGKGVVTDLDGN
jgi:hypothetical protein